MVAQPSQPRYMSVDEWRRLEQYSYDSKHEYIDGMIYDMAGGTLAHSRVSINVIKALDRALGNGPCRAYNSDAAARLSPKRYTYPDASVTCDACDRPTNDKREVQVPRVIVEVLSESTEAYDRGQKFGYYRACSSIEEYVLVATRYQLAEVYRRTPKGWTEYQVYGPDDVAELTSIDADLPLQMLYELTDVPETLEIPEGEV